MDTRTKVDMVEVEDIIDRLQDECACEHGHCCQPCKDRMALNGLIRANEMMAQDMASKEAQLREARAIVKRYGTHLFGCDKSKAMPTVAGVMYNTADFQKWRDEQKCTCGLDSALASES